MPQQFLPKHERTVGLEFEHVSKLSHANLAKALIEAKVPVDPSAIGRGNHTYQGWQVKGDGSITAVEKYPSGIELATPPLKPKRYRELITALQVASKHGGVNASCGLHVHVHAPELAAVLTDRNGQRANASWQEYVESTWKNVQKTMFSYMPPSRRNNNYCRAGVQWTTKYMALNFSPLYDRQTVEFRLHNATLNPLKAFAWAMLCQGLVDAMIKRVNFDHLPKPDERFNTEPHLIHTPRGGEFYLQRDKNGKWLIESAKLKAEIDALSTAFKEFRKQLKLGGKDPLAAFHYPEHGNAMTNLCKLAGINGMFRGYIEHRYDHMITKYGVADAKSQMERIVPDEADFYHEADLIPGQPMQTIAEPEDQDDDNDDDNDDETLEEREQREALR